MLSDGNGKNGNAGQPKVIQLVFYTPEAEMAETRQYVEQLGLMHRVYRQYGNVLNKWNSNFNDITLVLNYDKKSMTVCPGLLPPTEEEVARYWNRASNSHQFMHTRDKNGYNTEGDSEILSFVPKLPPKFHVRHFADNCQEEQSQPLLSLETPHHLHSDIDATEQRQLPQSPSPQYPAPSFMDYVCYCPTMVCGSQPDVFFGREHLEADDVYRIAETLKNEEGEPEPSSRPAPLQPTPDGFVRVANSFVEWTSPNKQERFLRPTYCHVEVVITDPRGKPISYYLRQG